MSYQPPPAPQPPPMMGAPAPSNNMVWGIISIFLCWPFAIPSLVSASKVNNLWMQGDVAGAQAASESAKKWGRIGIIVGAIWWVLYIILMVAGVFTFATSGYYG